MRYLAAVQYRGTRYAGFQLQPDRLTVQGELERALEDFYSEPVRVYGSSRTDAGAHAVCHPVCFDAPRSYPRRSIMAAVNHRLPSDIRLLDLAGVSDDFVPLREAVARTYVYLIWNSKRENVFLSEFSYHLKKKIDVDKLARAVSLFKGTHDFTAYSKKDTAASSRVRTINRAEVVADGELIAVVLNGSGFLYGMVRSLVADCISCASGTIEIAEIEDMLASGERTRPLNLVPAAGLFLYNVFFRDFHFEVRFPLLTGIDRYLNR